MLDISDFHHFRINHSELFADKQNHINGIENFWNQAKPDAQFQRCFKGEFRVIFEGVRVAL